MQAHQVVRDFFPGSERALRIGKFSVEDVAEQFGTPVFIYDQSVLQRKWELLRSTFPSRIDIHYSVKANPNPNILAFFLEQGAGLEIASAGELHQALAAGCRPERMLFAGPGKSPAELGLALSMNIGEIHAESLTELRRIESIAERLGQVAPVALRINPASEAQGGAMRMGGKATPFGIDEESLDSALDLVLASPCIELRGMHLFAGTQILDSEVLLCQYKKAIQIARRIAERQEQPLASVDFGGGLGVPYFTGDQPLDMVALKHGLDRMMDEIADDPLFAGTRFIIEPGRFLVAEAGIYLTRVLDVKVSRGKTFVIVDGGMNHHLAASGNLGQTIKRNFPVTIANKLQEVESDTVDIVGPLCTPLDVLARSIAAPRVEVGDLVAVLQSGAYARSASPLGFLSHPSPAEVMVAENELRLIRRRGSPSDYARDVETPSITAAKGVGRA
ncbi:MAG: diaminopimelate decarboxylase [Candidatus Korobacteraceae bacterium]